MRKSLEEPPPATIFLLVSHAPGRLLPTIRSRCRMMRFQPLPDDQIRPVIATERPDISEAELAALPRPAEGVPGRGLRTERRRAGQECVSTCRFSWVPFHLNQKKLSLY